MEAASIHPRPAQGVSPPLGQADTGDRPVASSWVPANPAPLGLAGFAMTTFVLSMYNSNLVNEKGLPVVLGLALAYGGIVQLLAGMWEFRTGNTFGAVAFSSYGAFWISFWALQVFYAKGIGGNVGHSVGLYLWAWAIFTAYMTVAALEVAALCGAGPRLTSEIDVAASHTEQLVAEWGPDAPEDSLAKVLARGLHGTIPVVVGAGLTTPIAYRWKTQINENAKQPCFSHELPELDHNELVGWEGALELGRFSTVFLDDSDAHPRVKERMALTKRLIAPNAAASFHLETRGQTTIERVISLVLLGDLVSIYLATLRGVDPGPVQLIEQLKAELA